MGGSNEAMMYAPVCRWLESELHARFRSRAVSAYDTHAVDLATFVRRCGLERFFATDVWMTYEIRVDVTGFADTRRGPQMAFVECKTGPVRLRDLAQLLGYCRIARPAAAYLLSPSGAGSALLSLIAKHHRGDVLEYDWPKGARKRSVVVGHWLPSSNSVDPSTVLPAGALA